MCDSKNTTSVAQALFQVTTSESMESSSMKYDESKISLKGQSCQSRSAYDSTDLATKATSPPKSRVGQAKVISEEVAPPKQQQRLKKISNVNDDNGSDSSSSGYAEALSLLAKVKKSLTAAKGETVEKSSTAAKGETVKKPSTADKASTPNLRTVADNIIIEGETGVSIKRFSTAAKTNLNIQAGSLGNKALSTSSPNMASGYTRFDEPNRSVSVTSRSGDSADSSSDIQLDIGDDDGGKVSVTSVHGFIMDPATNLEIMTPLESLQLKVKKVVEHLLFRIFTVVLIMLDFILVVIDLSISNCVSSNNGLEIMSHGIITFFLLEVAFRVFCKGKIFFDVILDVIDMLVVVISFIIDMVFVVISPSDCLEKENDKTAFARLIVIGRVVRIVRIARILYIAYMQRKHVSAATRQLVSQNKRRYQKDGFDLDLCYITERVIAMSFPSKGLMAVYRNPVEDVARFFNTKHEGHYKIFNLCSERKYDETLFHNCVERIFIDDHNVPKVREMLTFCDTAREWMAADPANIIAIHCKGGKGRTGTIICIWLIDCGLFEGAKTSLEYFGDRRTDLTKGTAFQGVETPSQSRYVGYFEKIKNEYNRHMPPRKLLKIKSFKIVGIGTVGNGDGSDLFIELRQDNISVFECDMGTEVNCKVSTFPDSDSVVIEPQNCPNVEGDIKVMFKTKNKKIPIGYDKCPFYFWFYTSFIEDNQLVLERDELDNPHKPKTHHVFGPNFSVIIDFETVELDDE